MLFDPYFAFYYVVIAVGWILLIAGWALMIFYAIWAIFTRNTFTRIVTGLLAAGFASVLYWSTSWKGYDS